MSSTEVTIIQDNIYVINLYLYVIGSMYMAIYMHYMLYYSSHKLRLNMNIAANLKNYGLDEKEAFVYTTLLKEVEASAYSLSNETKIPRATLYQVLDGLKEKGLVSISRVNGKKRYTAESPNRLMKILKEKEEGLIQIIPALLALGSRKEISPTVKLFLDREGTSRALDDILETLDRSVDKTIYVIAGLKLHYENSALLSRYIEKRERKNFHSKCIAYENPVDGNGKTLKLYPSNDFRETRYIPREFTFDSTIDIYGDKVAIFSEIDGKEHTVIIESPSISRTFREFHSFMWKHAEAEK